MKQKTFTDADGNQWPYWCGFELQLQKQNPEDKRVPTGDTTEDEVPAVGARRAKNKSTINGPVPEWLEALCTRSSDSIAVQGYEPLGDRDGLRYNFEQIIAIVKAIKTWCRDTDGRLPAVEALPITIGMLDEYDMDDAKQLLKAAVREKRLAAGELQRSTGGSGRAKRALRVKLKEAEEMVQAMQESLAVAVADCALTRTTVPSKRQSKKTLAKSRHATERIASEETESDSSGEDSSAAEITRQDTPQCTRSPDPVQTSLTRRSARRKAAHAVVASADVETG